METLNEAFPIAVALVTLLGGAIVSALSLFTAKKAHDFNTNMKIRAMLPKYEKREYMDLMARTRRGIALARAKGDDD